MSDYDLYYWPIPFRGQLIRWVMAYAGATWAEHDAQEVIALYKDDPDSQPLPFMAPPLLHDAKADVWMSQLTAVLSYLGDTHGLMPISPADRAATVKLICDANDVLNDITRGGGEKLWTQAAWDDTGLPRLTRWMAIFEQGAEAQTSVLGRDALGLADLVNAALWHTMTTRMHMLRPVLDTHAPMIAAHADRIAALPALAEFDRQELARLGDVYCGGQIETSLRHVLNMPERTSDGPI